MTSAYLFQIRHPTFNWHRKSDCIRGLTLYRHIRPYQLVLCIAPFRLWHLKLGAVRRLRLLHITKTEVLESILCFVVLWFTYRSIHETQKVENQRQLCIALRWTRDVTRLICVWGWCVATFAQSGTYSVNIWKSECDRWSISSQLLTGDGRQPCRINTYQYRA